eukprot:symbB.v1.2.011262.t1/scaffold748.1/size165754/16
MAHALAILAISSLPESFAFYDSKRKIEHARLYGNVDDFAYYFVDLVIGTPPQRASVILDTGSGVCAYPCANCEHCGHHMDPVFDIAKSSTASWLRCAFGVCPVGRCLSKWCSYYQGYFEGSSISGFWFEEWPVHNPPVKARMGCHSRENNLFFTQKANGMLGVGPTALDRKNVLDKMLEDKSHVSRRAFSICLAQWGGQFNIGGYNDSYHTGPLQRIPLKLRGFYGVVLTKMEVGSASITDWGTTMIDSGTTYTYMNSGSYKLLARAVEEACSGGLPRANSPFPSCLQSQDPGETKPCGGTKYRRECWHLPNGTSRFPSIKVFFNSVETKWVPEAYLYRKGKTDTYCYGFQDDGPNANTVLGAEIFFDLENQTVGIAPAKCPEHRDRPSHIQTTLVTSTTTIEPLLSSTVPVITGAQELSHSRLAILAAGMAGSLACLMLLMFTFKKVCRKRQRQEQLKEAEMIAVDNTARLMTESSDSHIL